MTYYSYDTTLYIIVDIKNITIIQKGLKYPSARQLVTRLPGCNRVCRFDKRRLNNIVHPLRFITGDATLSTEGTISECV